jgi:hypothetical protein
VAVLNASPAALEDEFAIGDLAQIILYGGLAHANHRKTAISESLIIRYGWRIGLKQVAFLSCGYPNNADRGERLWGRYR